MLSDLGEYDESKYHIREALDFKEKDPWSVGIVLFHMGRVSLVLDTSE
jgi:hypothetical protein